MKKLQTFGFPDGGSFWIMECESNQVINKKTCWHALCSVNIAERGYPGEAGNQQRTPHFTFRRRAALQRGLSNKQAQQPADQDCLSTK